uniref:ATP synthase complex subunit 8 n=1 Tax=Curculionoidea sp. 8 KM-2017 TaxID=2219421 RepID=A0A346RK00_9CUCU|nr:ATP synthase F0 subunit 8 [Curculionoidea sp. 8 KM-2017]
MPQMAPMNWVTLYMYFMFLFLMMIIINYYMFIYTPKMTQINKKSKNINWKW